MCVLSCTGKTTRCGDQCVDLASDAANCGACGTACPAGQMCRNGVCGGCSRPAEMCNGRCVETMNDPLNCGACGMVCPPSQTCRGGSCR
jgi:hypothetical protein